MSAERRGRLRAAGVAMIVTVLLSLLDWQNAPLVRRIDTALLDSFQRLSPRPYDPATPVRIVAIDRASLESLGQWPWPRPYLAELVDRLSGFGARAIGFDMVFSEADRTSPEEIAASLTRFGLLAPVMPRNARSYDEIFAASLARTPSVLGTILTGERNGRVPPVKASPSILGTDPTGQLAAFGGADLNRAVLAEAASGIGSVTLTPRDREDGVIRRVPLVSRIDGAIIPSLALETLRVAAGEPGYILRGSDAGGEIGGIDAVITGIRVGPLSLPATHDGAAWVRYSGGHPERTLSALAILDADPDDARLHERLGGAIVLVGATAPGLGDIVATPMGASVPGVEVHAELLELIMEGGGLNRPDWAAGAERASAWALGFAIALIAVLAGYAPAAIVFLGGIAVLPFLGFIAFRDYGLILGPTVPMLAGTAAWSAAALVDYGGARRERKEIRRQFEHFVAPDVIEEIARDPNRHMVPGGESRDLSILFCDVRHFSAISAQLEPSDLIDWLNGYLTPMTEAILAERGTIDKFIGDAVMAFWNAPRRDENHARGAVRGALRLVEAAEKMNVGYRARGLPPARIGIGVNTGPCSVGRIGAKSRLDYTCIGDPVNVASRLEGLSKLYGLTICLGEETARATSGFALIRIDRVEVLGRAGMALDLYTVAGDETVAASPGFVAQRAAWDDALRAYCARDLDAAERQFAAIAAAEQPVIDLSRAAQTLQDRIGVLRTEGLAPDWDAVYRASRK